MAGPDPVELFVRSIERFAERVDRVDDDQWDAPTPCDEWNVRDLVNHVCYEQLWAPHLVAGDTIDEVGSRYDGDVLGVEPTVRFRTAVRGSIEAFRSAELDATVHLSFGDTPCRVYLTQMLTDAEVHGWDLARGMGEDEPLDRQVVGFLLPEMQDQQDLIAASGVFGEPVPVDDDADDAARLLGLLGRRT